MFLCVCVGKNRLFFILLIHIRTLFLFVTAYIHHSIHYLFNSGISLQNFLFFRFLHLKTLFFSVSFSVVVVLFSFLLHDQSIYQFIFSTATSCWALFHIWCIQFFFFFVRRWSVVCTTLWYVYESTRLFTHFTLIKWTGRGRERDKK